MAIVYKQLLKSILLQMIEMAIFLDVQPVMGFWLANIEAKEDSHELKKILIIEPSLC